MKIALVGYMASGKSAMGRAVSASLGVRHIDLDSYIEKSEGRSIPDIFKADGEVGFREIESCCLREVLEGDDDVVLSLGGGTPVWGNNMDYITGKCKVIYLCASVMTLVDRLSRSRNPRPLVVGKSREELIEYVRENIEKREPYYKRAHYTVSVETLSIEDSARVLLSLIKEKILTTNNIDV
jgi:shikimate kinase